MNLAVRHVSYELVKITPQQSHAFNCIPEEYVGDREKSNKVATLDLPSTS